MKFQKSEGTFIIRLEKGEKIIETLTSFCEKKGIKSGMFHAIGAVLTAELGFYDLGKKEYQFKKFEDLHEIISLTGNVSLVEEKPFLHVHCVLSDKNYNCHGGHLKEGEVGATCEVCLIPSGSKIEREYDQEVGLKLLKLED
jgi:predicted DNA-binding protein with PD1-like motif